MLPDFEARIRPTKPVIFDGYQTFANTWLCAAILCHLLIHNYRLIRRSRISVAEKLSSKEIYDLENF